MPQTRDLGVLTIAFSVDMIQVKGERPVGKLKDSSGFILIVASGSSIRHRAEEVNGKLAANCGKTAPKHGWGSWNESVPLEAVEECEAPKKCRGGCF